MLTRIARWLATSAVQAIPGLRETKLGVTPAYLAVGSEKHGWHLGLLVRGQRGPKVWVDGQEGPEYDAFGGPPVFSQDGKHVA